MARWRKKARGRFDWDLFCDDSGWNSMAEKGAPGTVNWCSFSEPVGMRTFPGACVWAFPPPELAEGAVADAARWGARDVWMLVPRVTA
eukprot:2992002-Rhodomonas_salina.1